MTRDPFRRSAIQVAEEAIATLRAHGLTTLPYYYMGALPFVSMLLYFWAVMSRGLYGTDDLPGLALALALLFCWMRYWMARYMQVLHVQVSGLAAAPLSIAERFRMLARQSLVHAAGIAILPISLLALIPFGYAYAMLQNYGLFEDGRTQSFRDGIAVSYREGLRWPGQNHMLVWVLSPYALLMLATVYFVLWPMMAALTPLIGEVMVAFYMGVITFVLIPLCPVGIVLGMNIASGLAFLPDLLDVFLGIDVVFLDIDGGTSSPAFTMAVIAMTYLVLDPLAKAAYVLRCYYGRSMENAADLRRVLRTISGPMLVLLLVLGGGLLASGPALAQEGAAAVNAARLDAALDAEFEGIEYAWREAQEQPELSEDSYVVATVRTVAEFINGLIEATVEAIENLWEAIQDFLDWLFPERGLLDPGADSESDSGSAQTRLQVTMLVLLGVFLAILLFLLFRAYRAQRRVVQADAAVAAAVPDIEAEETAATDLPEDEWLVMAQDLAARREYRLAARAILLATLAKLGSDGLVQLSRSKTNFDYLRELRRVSHATGDVTERFDDTRRLVESVWYGHDACTEETLMRVRSNYAGIASRA